MLFSMVNIVTEFGCKSEVNSSDGDLSVWDQVGIELATPGSAVGQATYCAARNLMLNNMLTIATEI